MQALPTPQATSRVAWAPREEMDLRDWIAVGHRFGVFARCSQWWIGDWLRYGVSRWGEKYAEAARITGYDVGSLRNMAWVASQFDLSLRSDKLSWSHHALLAPLEAEERAHWLDRAVAERFSVADLRVELRSARAAALPSPDDGAGELGPGAAEAPTEIVCPHCGRAVNPT